jgi:uncharacterized protein (DUF488 family)
LLAFTYCSKSLINKHLEWADIVLYFLISRKDISKVEGFVLAKTTRIRILTIGHSTRTLEEFIELLGAYNVTLLVDVRTVPRSRHNPQFNKETLPNSLRLHDIKYLHMPEIGGLRRPAHDSVNLAWKNSGFRGYADFMQTKEFTDNLLKIITLAKENCLALMCAEVLPWRCHRSLISDALVARHVNVEHIIRQTSCIEHRLNEMAQVDGLRISYPLFTKETPQRTLNDFGT